MVFIQVDVNENQISLDQTWFLSDRENNLQWNVRMVFIQVDVNENQILMASCKFNIMDPGADSEGMLLSSRE